MTAYGRRDPVVEEVAAASEVDNRVVARVLTAVREGRLAVQARTCDGPVTLVLLPEPQGGDG